MSLRIGYVPEHFSTPLYFAQKHFGLDVKQISFPAGTGHMITSLRSKEIDVAIGLTEGWIAGLGRGNLEGDGGYRLVGSYVDTPLCWAISTGSQRSLSSVAALKGTKCGVSRIGSGSYVMSYALALEQGWLSENSSTPPFEFEPLENFEILRKAVNDETVDFFMWENFTSKKYYQNGEIKKIGEIYTPWPSWMIVASTAISTSDPRIEELFDKLDKGIRYFNNNQEEAVKFISTSLDYSAEDARDWLKTVRFSNQTKGVELDDVQKTYDTLNKAGILSADGLKADQMVAIQRVARNETS
ncbi:hypothetical protein K3495_g2450 [Podosphaera aphanis]|nr:hypothetical protein K3495_g2450 [Podosphaera aphanis]